MRAIFRLLDTPEPQPTTAKTRKSRKATVAKTVARLKATAKKRKS